MGDQAGKSGVDVPLFSDQPAAQRRDAEAPARRGQPALAARPELALDFGGRR